MTTFKYIFVFLLLFSSNLFAQEKYTLSGKVKDAANGEDLIGAVVYIKEISNGVVTNEYGFYSITLPSGKYTVNISYLGFAIDERSIELNANTKLDVELKQESSELQSVTVTAEKNIKDIRMSVSEVQMKDMKKLPALLGEVDVLRSIQLLPGVTTVGEGSSGFNVRGGSIDQNLVLLDEAPVYNSSHLLGFFSVFNPDAVKDVQLMKGGIPAQYGGRISSILDVRMKDGNNKRFAATGGIGTIFSRLTLEGPIVKDKGSFIIAARRSYLDVLAKPFLKGDLKKGKFYFYDLTLKANYNINRNNKVYLSGYLGRDVFGAGFGFNWGNATTTLRWNHIFNDKLFLNLTTFYSNYNYQLATDKNTSTGDGFNWKSNIVNYSVKPEFKYYLNPKTTITFGGQSILYDFQPGKADIIVGNQTTTIKLKDKYAFEHAVYAGSQHSLGPRLQIEYGLRYSFFDYVGKGTVYQYGDTTSNTRKHLSNQYDVAKGNSIKKYGNLEPRFSTKYELNEKSSIKASYNRTAQYIHLISNTVASLPFDIWTPSTNNIAPQIGDQVAVGYFRNFKENMFEASAETFYKNMQNQIDYINGADIFLNPYLEGELLRGRGRAYGLELFLKKNKGHLTGWISYTLSRTERKVIGINNDQWYPSRFDKTHNLNVVAMYELNSRFSFSANFVFGSGTPVTFPNSRIEYQNIYIPQNSGEKRNNYRIPPYNRMDISATIKNKKKEGRKWDGEWVFSVYNLYNRRNPFAIYFRQQTDDPTKTEAIRFSVFGSFIPGITYNFKF